MINLSIKKVLMILIGVILCINCGCYMIKNQSKYDIPDNFISLDNKIQITELASDLDTIVMNQISPDLPKFAKENYVIFSNNPTQPKSIEPWKSCIIEVFDLYVDFRLLNKFVFVFTKQNTETIIGLIRQTEMLEQPKKDYWYYIRYEKILDRFGKGEFDIYGFHNDTLVFKNLYSPSENPERPILD